MKGWKIALLILIGLVFIITTTFALTWYSISSTALNANTYKKMINADTITQIAANGELPAEFSGNIDKFVPVITSYFDVVFNYIKGNTNTISLQLPNDELMKPIVIAMAKEQYPEASQLTDEQFNILFEQQYPTVKQDLQTRLDNVSLDLENELKDSRTIIYTLSTIAMIALIVSIVLLVLVVLLIRQLRSIFNWIGSYLLITGIIVTIIGIAIISFIPMLASTIPDANAISMLMGVVSTLFSPLIITGIIVLIIGLAMLFVKFAFKKPEPNPQ